MLTRLGFASHRTTQTKVSAGDDLKTNLRRVGSRAVIVTTSAAAKRVLYGRQIWVGYSSVQSVSGERKAQSNAKNHMIAIGVTSLTPKPTAVKRKIGLLFADVWFTAPASGSK